jgi:hypothetical protein
MNDVPLIDRAAPNLFGRRRETRGRQKNTSAGWREVREV